MHQFWFSRLMFPPGVNTRRYPRTMRWKISANIWKFDVHSTLNTIEIFIYKVCAEFIYKIIICPVNKPAPCQFRDGYENDSYLRISCWCCNTETGCDQQCLPTCSSTIVCPISPPCAKCCVLAQYIIAYRAQTSSKKSKLILHRQVDNLRLEAEGIYVGVFAI